MSGIACFDVRCTCGQRIGWRGKVTDRPNCPACGNRPSDDELQRGQDQLDEIRRLLLTHPRDADGPTLVKQREMSGLSLDKAASLAKLTRFVLGQYECGAAKPPARHADQLQAVYGCGSAGREWQSDVQ